MDLLLKTEYKTENRRIKKLLGVLFGAFFCAALSISARVSADPVRPLSDRQFEKACVEMTGEYKQDVTQQQADRNPYITHRLILKSDDSHVDPDDYGAVDAIRNKEGMYVLQFNSTAETRRAERLLEKESATEYVEPDYVVFACSEEESVESTALEGLEDSIDTSDLNGVGVTVAANDNNWDVNLMGFDAYQQKILSRSLNKEIIVAVLDTGVSYNHPLLKNRLITDSRAENYVVDYKHENNVIETYTTSNAEENYPGKDKYYSSHGTHVAGIIARCASKVNVKILPMRVLSPVDGTGSLSNVLNAINKAIENGASVINLSMSMIASGPVVTLENCIKKATDKGVVIVAASGNNGTDMSTNHVIPGYIDKCVVVGSVNQSKNRANSSNYGSSLDVVAPGESVYSSVLTGSADSWTYGYAWKSGTSMATPHVSAQAAMLKMIYPNYPAQQIEKLIQQTAIDLGAAGKDNYYGYGLANLVLPSHTISYQPGAHGTFAATSSTVEYGLATPSAPAVSGESGYQFTGWSPAVNSKVTGDVTYVAQWKYIYENSNPHANVTYRVPLKTRQSTDRLRVEGLAGSDSVINWVSSNPKIVTVSGGADGRCVVRAGKKKGNVTVTATTASGRQISFRIKVQKKKVNTKKILTSSSTIVLKAGEVFQLEPTLYPVSSTDKIKYKSMKKKVASVNRSGMITAKKKGKAKIYIYSGKKKKKINVIVQ